METQKADLLQDLGIGGSGATTKTRSHELGSVLAILLGAALASDVESHAAGEDLSSLNLEDAGGNSVMRHTYAAGAAANTAITIAGLASDDRILAIVRFKGLKASTPTWDGLALIDPTIAVLGTNSLTLPIDTSEDALLILWVDVSRI